MLEYVKRNRIVAVIRRHTESRNGIAPKGNDRLAEGCGDMHQSRITGNDKLGLPHPIRTLIQRELATSIINFYGIRRGNKITPLPVLLPAQ